MTVRQQTGPPGPVAAPVDFTDFYRAHFHRIAVQLYAYLGDHAEAQDLTQEAFCRTLERWERVSGGLLMVTSAYGGVGLVTDNGYLDVPALCDPLRADPDSQASVEVLPDGTVQVEYGTTRFLGVGQGLTRTWTRYS